MCKCVKCGWEWLQRQPGKVPKMCPACKRRDWDGVNNSLGRPLVAAVQRRCLKCGWEWKQRQASKVPLACPACKNYKWNKPTPQAECFMCGGRGCSICVPPAVPVPSVVYTCSNCHDRGMVAARGGCPMCGKVYEG